MDQFNSAEARALLDTIYTIRELQADGTAGLSLPRIVVVGDRSAGKSSVLEAISRVRFGPVESGHSTRFATELVLRKAAHSKVSVRIRWADEFSPGSKPQPNQDRTRFDKDSLPKIISQAEEIMRGPTFTPSRLSTSRALPQRDRGPDARGEGDSGPAGRELYGAEKQHRLGCRVSQRAGEPDGTRARQATTRPESVPSTSLPSPTWPARAPRIKKNCLRLVNGYDKTYKLALGWHVLHNLPQQGQKTSADDRDAKKDAFFREGRWGSISPPRRGAEELRKKLSKVLLEHIRLGLPNVVSKIEESLRDREKRLERVGKSSRETTDEVRSYLLDIPDRFQRLGRDGIEGRYADSFFGDLYDGGRKIRAQLRNLNSAFGETLSGKGAKYSILSDAGGLFAARENGRLPEMLQPFLGLYSRFPDPEPIAEEELCRRLNLLASINGGMELPGAPNSGLVAQLFKEQAQPWRDIAALHLELVSNYTKSFVEQLIGHVIAGSSGSEPALADGGPATNRTVVAVLCGLVDPFFEAKAEVLRAKLDELLRPYTTGFNIPLELKPEMSGQYGIG
ncbi:hypothetical protein GGTG_04216 [Gaeumannomyces tritici R3-111a-1]|uniref:Uncharacterized protein n=1 Tax=Gaeumannomyces tritici (strain R3-111a-1) TaxID=644352 RepID=J3NSG4_GAET3|nr:hypothetical protein GGTG_04216 [Gaeumannomyces tritici R3-111a-1]EJT79127.1 hypothetical protein GGTG_04216 [Gaeumannomyces tritici R3-111a-1]